MHICRKQLILPVAAFLAAVFLLASCSALPSTITIAPPPVSSTTPSASSPSPSSSPPIATTPSSQPTATPSSSPTATPSPSDTAPAVTEPAVDPRVPATQVDIYNKSFDWPPADPADWVMSPSVIGFGWNLTEDPDRADWLHHWGARFISEISLWNHDSWRTLADLPPEMAGAYVTDIDGNPVYNQEMLYLNLMHPAFRQWLKNHIAFELDHGADGFVFDETSGASQAVYMGAGLDEYSLAGFGAWLAAKYTPAELASLGVSDTATFDYRDFLAGHDLLDDYANGGFWDLPLGQDYYDYLFGATQDFIIEMIDYARSYAAGLGREIAITANYNPLYNLSPVGASLDYFTIEHNFYDDGWRADSQYGTRPGGYPIAPAIRYANSHGQIAVPLMGISDYGKLEHIGEPAATRLVLHAFAETYANLGYFCYFDLDYGFIGNTYAADHARLRPYYAFLREHPDLFNGLTQRPRAAVVMPPHVVMEDLGPLDGSQGAAWILGEMNVDYTVIDISQPLDDYDLLIVQGYAWSDAEMTRLLDYVNAGGNIIAIDERFGSQDAEHLPVTRPELAPLKVDGRHTLGAGSFTFFSDYLGWKYYALLDPAAYDRISGAVAGSVTANTAPDGVLVLPCYDDDRLVVHILNDNFDGADYSRLADLAITIELPEGFSLAGDSLTVCSPYGGEPVRIPLVPETGKVSFTLPSLYIWSVAASD